MGKLQKILMPLFLMVISFGLAGCGGGNDAFSGGDGTTIPGVGAGGGDILAITLVLVQPGTTITTTVVSATAPGELQATVTSNGVLMSNELVTFTTTIGTLNPGVGTATTDNSGVASMGLLDGGVAGAGKVTATVTSEDGEVTAQTSTNFTILNNGTTGNGPAITLSLLDQAGLPTASVSSTAPGTLQATVTDNGTPLASEVITFTSTLGTLDPVSGTALSNASGIGNVNLLDGGMAGAGTAIATADIAGMTIQSSVNFQMLAGPVTTTTIDMGNGTGNTYVPDVISLGGITTLSAGGTLTATVNIVESSNANAAYTTPANVTFTSTCVGTDQARMDTPVTTVNGTASSTYLAQGCVGTDVITAAVGIGGTTYTAQANVTIQPATVGSIQFTSATPAVIALQGTGGSGLSETSTVVFTVFDQSGAVVPNQAVDFTLSTSVGGISLSQTSATTNASGQVQTVVNSGAVNTSVRVTATVASTAISTQSVALAVSTGIPDNNSFTIAAETLNPFAWDCIGLEVPITAIVADHFNNPAPDGTAVAFQTEGGSIDGSCTTVSGECAINWKSDGNKPSNARVTILASVIGEEGFTDTNGNGRFDDGEPFTDLPEAWRDDDEDNTRGATEEFLDFNSDRAYQTANGLYNGTLCAAGSVECDPSGALVHARDDLVLVLASVDQRVTLYETFLTGPDVQITSILLPDDESVRTFRVDVQDPRGQIPPAETTISVSTDNGKIAGGSSTDVLNTNAQGPSSLSFAMKGDSIPDQGVLTVTVKIPSNDCQSGVDLLFGFTVSDTEDVTPPVVVGMTPAPGATGVAVDVPVLEITFSETMDISTLAMTVIGGTTVPGFTSFYDTTANKAFLFPTSNFDANTLYTVTIGGLARDTVGNYLNGGDATSPIAHQYIFRTAAP